MCYRRRVSIDLALEPSGERRLEVVLPPVLPRERMLQILGERLARDGWRREESAWLGESDGVRCRFDLASGQVEVCVEGEQVAARLARGIEELRSRFREKYVPETLAEAVAEGACGVDSSARIVRSDSDGTLVVAVEAAASS
jgi:hypothetical protein